MVKKDKSIKRIFANKGIMRNIMVIAFFIFAYVVYTYFNAADNTDVTPMDFFRFILKVAIIIILLLFVIPTLIFLFYSKNQLSKKPDERSKEISDDEVVEKKQTDTSQDNMIPEFYFETSKLRSSCPINDTVEGFAVKERIHVNNDGSSTSVNKRTGDTKKIKIPEYPNVNNDKWIHISKIPDMKNYVHKKDLPCMSNYIHKNEIPNMSEYVHKTKIPPVKELKKTKELPEDMDVDKMEEIKKTYGIDMNNYVLKTSIPQCLKCPDMNDYVLKSSVPPF